MPMFCMTGLGFVQYSLGFQWANTVLLTERVACYRLTLLDPFPKFSISSTCGDKSVEIGDRARWPTSIPAYSVLGAGYAATHDS